MALSLMLKEPLRPPLAVGAKVTLTLQLCPTLRMLSSGGTLQVLVWEKSPVVVMPVIFSVAVPVFVMVTVCGELTVPTVWFPKLRLVGETVTAVAAVTPVPVTVMVWGLPLALSVIVIWLVSALVVEGVNVMLIVQ